MAQSHRCERTGCDQHPGSVRGVPDVASSGEERIRAAELVAALSLATDLGLGVQLEHGLHSTRTAMRLCERLGVDSEVASQTYYACLLFHIGCTVDADIAAETFGDDAALRTHFYPVMFGSRSEMMAGVLRALASPGSPALLRGVQIARGLPKVIRQNERHLAALCEVAGMLAERLGQPTSVRALFPQLTERWDGKGFPGLAKQDGIPLPLRIAQVARDAAFQRMVGGEEFAARVVRERAGAAFDPAIAALLAEKTHDIMALDDEGSAWDEALSYEPTPRLILRGQAIDRALAAMGDFADLVSPYLVGHSAGVAELAGAAAQRCGFSPADVVAVRRAALVHDLGRVAVPARIWQKASPLTPDDWERVRLHAYHSERVLCRSPFLATLTPVATAHHERLDGRGYHRGATAASLPPPARLLAAADAYHAMTQPRPHREALSPPRAAKTLSDEARSGRLDTDAVSAVLEAAGHPAPRLKRPAGLTEREAEVIGLLVRGSQTKQIARTLGISVKTADRHIQNAYAKMGVSTRAAAALFAMQHGLATWGELPIGRASGRS
jgi:HD-GYP domain-containing protein (c-di-GMP phosphodiesterase class II)